MPQQTAETKWNNRVDELVQQGMSRRDARSRIAKEEPDLHTEYLLAANASRPRACADIIAARPQST